MLLISRRNYFFKRYLSLSPLLDSSIRSIEAFVLDFKHNSVTDETIGVDGDNMNLENLIAFGKGAKITINSETAHRLQKSRDIVDTIVNSGVPTYGINTGFGLLSHTNVSRDELTNLQHNLIRSHASGVGESLDPAIVRRIMALRINTLARGKSGVSLETFNNLVKLFNSGCTPEVPCQGTVGASGDLAPLAHIALGLIGEGRIFSPSNGKYLPAHTVLSSIGLSPTSLQAKDGLSLVNGTQFITGVGSVALQGAIHSLQVTQPIAALALVGLFGHMNAMDSRVFDCRPHAGSLVVAKVIRGLIPPDSHVTTTKDVQDYYSIRCIPQIHGPSLEILPFLRAQLETEMNSSTDNPLIFTNTTCSLTGRHLPINILSAGNFHGEYPAKALDTLALYVGEIGRAATARIMLLVDPNRSRQLPPFLTSNPGVNSGLMCWELTAAALDAENRTLSMPASAETANTGAGKEDHVSMGGFAARKAVQVVDNVQKILAIELLAVTHAIHHRRRLDPSFKIPDRLNRLYDDCSKITPPSDNDRYLKDDFDGLLHYIKEILPLQTDLINPK